MGTRGPRVASVCLLSTHRRPSSSLCGQLLAPWPSAAPGCVMAGLLGDLQQEKACLTLFTSEFIKIYTSLVSLRVSIDTEK